MEQVIPGFEPLVKLFGPGAIFVAAVAVLWRLIFTPRKGKTEDGRDRERSAVVVPGWEHDRLIDLLALVRLAHDRREQEMRADFDKRISEWRKLRDEERVRAAESDARLKEMDARLDRFDDVLEQMLALMTELAQRASVA